MFYKPKEQEIEYLLYDFGMNVNDTAIMYWCQNPNWEVHVRIDSIDTQHIAGAERRVFYVSSKDMYGDEWHWLNTWVEGIGAMEGLLYSCHVVNAGGITLHELLCYHEDGELVWQNPEYNTCTYPYDAVEENKDAEISIYPNPGNDMLNIRTALKNAFVEVYDINGRLIHNQALTENVTAIDTGGWADGVYIWKVYTTSVSTGSTTLAESGKWIKE